MIHIRVRHNIHRCNSPVLRRGRGATKSGATLNPGNLDQRLAGLWRYTESYVSGSFSGAAQWKMQINADGTYLYGDGQFSGGGAQVSPVRVEAMAMLVVGKWKTEGKVIYVDEGYGWQPYARYYVEGYDLMFTFENGKRPDLETNPIKFHT